MGTLGIDFAQVQEWLDKNTECMQEYFVKKADILLINKWLISHGFHTLQEYVSGKRGSMSRDSGSPASPTVTDNGFFSDKDISHRRSNSKKHLRHDYARSKTRNTFRTFDPTTTSTSVESTIEKRRSSLKGMRQFLSLPPTSVNMLSMLISSKIRLPRYASKDEEFKRELRGFNEKEFFLEIVKEISHELDLRNLSGKIVNNIQILLDAQGSSLFLVEKKQGKSELVSKVFDMCAGTSTLPSNYGDNVVKVPWGQGIIGYVAETGLTVNIDRASQDPRYNNEVDTITGHETDSLLCMPIRNADNETIGVAQVINKRPDESFSLDDEKVFETYLAFCGMAISNAQMFESYTVEYDRNRVLLEVAHDLFEEQTSVEKVVQKIMQKAQSLLKCERCSVLLRDQNSEKVVFSKVFDLVVPKRNGHTSLSRENITDLKMGNKIAEIVASTGETVNIADAYQDTRFNMQADKASGFRTRCILCKPIRNSSMKCIGVAQTINRTDGLPFDDHDDQLFEAFTIFCGLGINNCILYDEVKRAAVTQAVALEVLSYHATVPADEVYKIKNIPVPEAKEWNLTGFDFNDYSLDSNEMIIAAIRIFKDTGLIRRFKIEIDTLVRWLLTVRKNYRNVAYHNWRHAFNVCQFMFAIITNCGMDKVLSHVERLAMIVACLCHDLDHRGTNNAFQQKTSSHLAQLYGTKATLEHHHFNHAVMILNSEGHNLFSNMTSEDYVSVTTILKQCILATDLSLHFQIRSKFFQIVESGSCNWEDRDHKEVLRSILMTSCDIASITKSWDVQRRTASLVMTEFFEQGDKERNELKIQPQTMMDREKQEELPKLQMGWIDGVCVPLYKALGKVNDSFEPMLGGVMSNRANWEKLDEQRLADQMTMNDNGC
ncbi:unnamed protein product [Owenia fusiformis]|uniref:Phosphodiesterase n=1 Tax=Owenia fusiformis TaxID=6347 RepID=A0A8S4N2Y0_OWEFU|nr:unnamed protein product [Owenia fusiformis]